MQLLVNQFLQIDDQGLMALREDVAAVFAALVTLIGFVDAARWLMTDMAGWVLLAAGLTLIPAVPNSALRDALIALAEPSKSTVDAVNGAHPGVGGVDPYPAASATTRWRRTR